MSEQAPAPGGTPVPNAALDAAMKECGFTVDKLARAADVDAKTVWRLKHGETVAPQQANAEALAEALRTTPQALWPDRFAPPAPRSPDSRSVTMWDERADIPKTVWNNHFASAHHQIDVLVYGGTFLFDSVHRFLATLRTAIAAGVQVRVAVGDPHSHAVRQRGDEAQIGHSLASRCELTLTHLQPLRDATGQHVRVHDTPLYASLFRVDDTMIANHHIYGSPASENPRSCFIAPRRRTSSTATSHPSTPSGTAPNLDDTNEFRRFPQMSKEKRWPGLTTTTTRTPRRRTRLCPPPPP